MPISINEELPETTDREIERWEWRRVYFYGDLGQFLGLVRVSVKIYWSEGEVVEKALRRRPDLGNYSQVWVGN